MFFQLCAGAGAFAFVSIYNDETKAVEETSEKNSKISKSNETTHKQDTKNIRRRIYETEKENHLLRRVNENIRQQIKYM